MTIQPIRMYVCQYNEAFGPIRMHRVMYSTVWRDALRYGALLKWLGSIDFKFFLLFPSHYSRLAYVCFIHILFIESCFFLRTCLNAYENVCVCVCKHVCLLVRVCIGEYKRTPSHIYMYVWFIVVYCTRCWNYCVHVLKNRTIFLSVVFKKICMTVEWMRHEIATKWLWIRETRVY